MFGFNLGVAGVAGGGVAQTWATWDGSLDGTPVQFETGSVTATTLTDSCVMSSDVTLVVYRYNSTLKARVISTSAKVPTSNTAITVVSSNINSTAVCMIDSTRAMLIYVDVTAGKLQSVVLSLSGTTVTAGSIVTIDSTGNAQSPIAVTKLTTDQCVAAYGVSGTGSKAVCLSTSSTVITVRTPFTFTAQLPSYVIGLAQLTSTTIYAIYDRANSDGFGVNIVLSIATNTITAPTAESAFTAYTISGATLSALDSAHVVVAAVNSGASSIGKAITSSISGTTITNGAGITFDANTGCAIAATNNAAGLCTINSSTAILTYTQNSLLWGMVLSISGTTTTAATRVNLVSGTVTTTTNRCNTLLDANRVLSLYSQIGGGNGNGTSLVLSIS